MPHADRERAPGERKPAPAGTPASGPWVRRILETIVLVGGLVGFVLLFRGHGAFHIAAGVFVVGVAVAVLAAWGHPALERKHEFVLGTFFVAAITLLVWAVLPQHVTPVRPAARAPAPTVTKLSAVATTPPASAPAVTAAHTQAVPVPRPAKPPRPPLSARLASAPLALSLAARRLWFLTGDAFGYLKPADGMKVEQRFPFMIGASAIAANRQHVVVTRRGVAYFLDADSAHRSAEPVRYSERGGPVAVSRNFAWLLNESHSKVDRINLTTHTFKELPAPGVPTAVTVAHGFVWVTVNRGWLVRFNARGGEQVARRQIVRKPAAIVAGYGYLWVAHPTLGLVTRLDPTEGTQVGAAIHVEVGVRELAAADGTVWAAGPRHIVRIEPVSGQISQRLSLGGTLAMVGAGHHVFVAAPRRIIELPPPSR